MSSWLPTIPTAGAAPRFALLNTDLGQLVSNPDFDTDTSGWSTGTRELDLSTPFYEYALKIDGGTISETTCATGEPLAKRTFVVSLYARAANTEESVWVVSGGDKTEHEMTGLSDTHYTHHIFVQTWTSWRMATSFLLHFHPDGDLWVDRVRVYEVSEDVDLLPSPESEEFHFVRSIWTELITLAGEILQFSQGYQFLGFLCLGALTVEERTAFDSVDESSLFFFWPRSDDSFAALCQHSGAGDIRRHTISTFDEDSSTLLLLESVDLLNAQRVVTGETS